MNKDLNWIILYDIRDGKRLRKVSKIVESYAGRIQKSVFEIKASENVIENLKQRLERIIDCEEDFVLFFNICEKDFQKKEQYGKLKTQQIVDDKFIIL